MIISEYLTALDQWMQYYGFTNMEIQPGLEVERFFWKTATVASKIGLSDRYCFIKHVPDNITAQFAKSYSSALYNYAYLHKQTLGRFFRSMMMVFPVLIVDKASQELVNFIHSYQTNKFKSVEFPCLIELSTGNIYYYEKTPLWGALYYNGFRQDAYKFFSPNAWHQITSVK
jgi:hypothetical protein